ncbi:MAG TPA: hypothetical protein VGJ36_01740 [Gemmatimonadales bacterium]
MRDELRGERRPHVSRLAVSVEQDHGRAGTAAPDVEAGAVGGDSPGVKARGEWLYLGAGGIVSPPAFPM